MAPQNTPMHVDKGEAVVAVDRKEVEDGEAQAPRQRHDKVGARLA